MSLSHKYKDSVRKFFFIFPHLFEEELYIYIFIYIYIYIYIYVFIVFGKHLSELYLILLMRL